MHRVLDTRFLFLHLGLGRRPDLDDRHATDQLGEPFLQLLAVVLGRRVLDLRAQLLDAAVPTEKAVPVVAVDVAASRGYASRR
jgi:hypothetical protein